MLSGKTQILLGFISIMVISSYVDSITIEQTNGYADTWKNMNRTCSLLGDGLKEDMQLDQVNISNIDDITGTGWISADVTPVGTLSFVGCFKRTIINGSSGLEISYSRIAECFYFCDSGDILLHQNLCYCIRQVGLFGGICESTECGSNRFLFCGNTSTATYKCMCQYRHTRLLRQGVVGDDCVNKTTTTCVHQQMSDTLWNTSCRLKTEKMCDILWNGRITLEVFVWRESKYQQYCVAVHRTNSSGRLLPLSLPCSTNLPGICNNGTRISSIPLPASRNCDENYITCILGAGTFVVILTLSVVVIVCLVIKRRRKGRSRSDVPCELHDGSTSEEKQYQNIYFETDNTISKNANSTEDKREYDSIDSGSEHASLLPNHRKIRMRN